MGLSLRELACPIQCPPLCIVGRQAGSRHMLVKVDRIGVDHATDSTLASSSKQLG